MPNIQYLTTEQVILVHELQIERFGGDFGLRDFSLLESAVLRPQAGFGGKDLYPSVFDKAAALMHSLILNHPFVDGNKRIGAASALIFLEHNKYSLRVANKELVNTALKLALKERGVKELSKWLKKDSKRI